MILSASVLLLCLLAGAEASAIKGRHEQRLELDPGLASPVELRRNQQKSEHLPLEHRDELPKSASHEEKLEDLHQQREETPTGRAREQREEQLAAVKAPLRAYEAKPQLRGEDLAKGQQPARPLSASKIHPEERLEEPLVQLNEKHEEPLGQQREEVLKSTEANRRAEQQVVDLKPDLYQQRRLDADEPLQQVQQHVRYDDQPLLQQQAVKQEEDEEGEQRTSVAGVKGGARAAFAAAEPYAFDYSIEGSSRRETGDVHGVVRGQYTVLHGDGSQRVVDYIADRDGFRAQINTGELGTESQQPASVLLRSSQPAAQDISLQLEGKTREFLTAAPAAPPTKIVARPDNWNLGGSGKTSWEPQQAPESIKEERAPILITNQRIESTVQRIEEAPLRQDSLKQEPLKQEPLKEEPLKQEPLKHEALKQEPTKEELASAELPAKKAELKRTPKAIAEPRSSPVIQARASFESATAHRPIVHSLPVAPIATHQHQHPHHHHHHHHLQPVVHRHHSHHHLAPAHHRVHVSPPVRAYPLAHGAVPTRAQLQHDRYPPLNQRVSFYSADNLDDEQPASAAGFEHPINSS